jgi:hypothetical protein
MRNLHRIYNSYVDFELLKIKAIDIPNQKSKNKFSLQLNEKHIHHNSKTNMFKTI